MQTPLSLPPLTRFDAVMWFLRVHLWLSLVAFLLSLFQPFMLITWSQVLLNAVLAGVPVLLLALFPSILASSALGRMAREPVSGDLRFLTGRCVGLTLFVNSLGRAALYSILLLYSFVPKVSSAWVFGSGVAHSFTIIQIVTSAISFSLGFALAFGPAIRDSFRAR